MRGAPDLRIEFAVVTPTGYRIMPVLAVDVADAEAQLEARGYEVIDLAGPFEIIIEDQP